MTNIENLASQYIAKGGSKYSEDEITKAIQNIKSNIDWKSNNSIFNFGDDFSVMSEEDFYKMLRSATSSSGNLDNDFAILYEIINTDENNGLTKEELGTWLDIDCKGKLEGFDIWGYLNIVELDASSVTDSSGTTEDDTTVSDTDETGTSEPSDNVSGEDGDSSDAEPVNTTTTSKPQDFSNMENWNSVADYIKAFLIEDNAEMDQPSEIIEYLKNNGTLSADEAEFARQALIYGSQDTNMQTSIRQWLENGDTFDQAIEKLGIDPNESDLYKTAKELKSADNDSLSGKVDIDECAKQLNDAMGGDWDGTDEELLENILFDTNISANDFVEIVKRYEEKYLSDGMGLVTKLEKETSGDLESRLTTQLANRLVAAASLGNEDAIDLLCKQVYSATNKEDLWSDGPSTGFILGVFSDDVSNEIIYKLNKRYTELYPEHDLSKDVDKDDADGFWNWGKLDSAVEKIKEAARYQY